MKTVPDISTLLRLVKEGIRNVFIIATTKDRSPSHQGIRLLGVVTKNGLGEHNQSTTFGADCFRKLTHNNSHSYGTYCRPD